MVKHGKKIAIGGNITAMTQALDCEMIAEGVETVEQLEALRGMGCDYAQGWLIGKPVSLHEVLETG